MDPEQETIASLLNQRDEATFEQVFKTHFKNLHAYAYTILKDETMAEEIVQQVFFRLWERSEKLNFNGSVTAYLYRAVHNESLNHIKHRKVRSDHQLHVAYLMKQTTEHASKKILTKEMEARYRSALNELPEQCRTVFQLSRFEDLKYREIADRLHISVKTVENQMSKALKLMRTRLADFLTVLIILFHL
ncbi:MAG: RNA polymerase sigma-70 factor [Terrimonas sp.]|nr:RNA polymerase sigma-70 factor [Terrimonas sp.]